MSPKASAKVKREARAIVLARDSNTCQRCGANLLYKLASIQHRRPRGAGGSAWVDIPSNLVLLCGSATSPGCHAHVETHRVDALADGWLIPKLSSKHPSEVPLLSIHGWVLLTDDGERIPYVSGVAG
jgi:5-methylcytosine-specific restriction endonuclease McrA